MMFRLKEDPSSWPVRLTKFSDDFLKRFFWDYDYAVNELNGDEFYNIMQTKYPGLSEDGSSDLAQWVVINGEEYYAKVFNDPHLVPEDVNLKIPELGAHGLAMREYKKRFGTSDYPSYKEDPFYVNRY